MRDELESGREFEMPWSEEQAFAAMDEHKKTMERIADLKARWAAHVNAMFSPDGTIPAKEDGLALLDGLREATESSATQKALWNSHVESMFPSTIRPDLATDPHIETYYQSLEPPRVQGNPKALRKARENAAWALLRDRLTAVNAGLNKEQPAAIKASNQSKPITQTRSKAMSKEDEVNPDAETGPSKKAAVTDLKKATQTKAGTFALHQARKKQKGKQTRKTSTQTGPAANLQHAVQPTNEQALIDAQMMTRIANTAEGMMSAPHGAVPDDETMTLVVTEDLKAIATIQSPELRQRALWMAAESRSAQPAYDAEFVRQAPPEMRIELQTAVDARATELAAMESANPAQPGSEPTMENSIAPAAARQPSVSPEDLVRLRIPVATATLLTSLPIDDITLEEAAESVHHDILALTGIENPGMRERALSAIAESSRAQPRYEAELLLQASELAAEVAARVPDIRAAAPGVPNTIQPAPTAVLGDAQENALAAAKVLNDDTAPPLDASALEAVAEARAKDRQTVAKMMGWNTIARSAVAENKPAAQVSSEFTPAVAAPAAPVVVSTVVPDEVERAYLHVGNRFYMPKNRERVAFEDHGDKLKTALNVAPVTVAMVQIAQARGWTSIKVDGTPEFRKDAWREAALRGIAVEGYKPTELDLADLARRLPAKTPENQVTAMAMTAMKTAAPAPIAQGGMYISAEDSALLAMAKAAWAAPGAPASATPAVPSSPTAAGLATPVAPVPPGDKLVAHGPAAYQHDENNPGSYFVILENHHGKQRTVWGVKLGEAIAKSGVKVGDQITLFKNGEEQVTVDANVKDDAGKVVGTHKIGAIRNEWAVKAHNFTTLPPLQAVQQHPDLAGAFGAATKLGLQAKADGFSPAALAIIAARQQENIGKAIARGELPNAELKETAESKRGAQQVMAQ